MDLLDHRLSDIDTPLGMHRHKDLPKRLEGLRRIVDVNDEQVVIGPVAGMVETSLWGAQVRAGSGALESPA